MKKKLFIALAILFAFFVVLVIGSRGDKALKPAVAKELSFSLPDLAPEDNAFIGIYGLDRIQGGDVVTAGLKYLKEDPETHDGAKQEPAFDFSYKNPCLVARRINCLDQIEADASVIDEAVQKNHDVMERYRIVQKMPFYANTFIFSTHTPRYGLLIGASRLLDAKALLDVKRGDLEGGLNSIEADLDYYKKIWRSEYITLTDLTTAIPALKNNLIVLNKIIEDERIDLSGQEERLRKMLDLDLDANQMIARALTMEKRRALRNLGQFDDEAFSEGLDLRHKLMILFLYKKNMTLNRLAALSDAVIQQIQTAPVLKFPEYYGRLEGWHSSEIVIPNLSMERLLEVYGVFFYKNYFGEWLLSIGQPLYLGHVPQANDNLVYARLVRAQLELRLLPDRPEDIAEALAGLGPETWNPYTGRPFQWDKDDNSIWGESAVRDAQSDGPGRLEVAVPARLP